MAAVVIKSRAQLFDREKCVKNVGGSQFDLVLYAAARARQMEVENKASDRANGTTDHLDSTLSALFEIQEGKWND